MPWGTSRPNGTKTAAKYRTREHVTLRKHYAAQLQRDGYLTCTQPVCVHMRRPIRPGEPWHLGHNDAGSAYIGPVHASCNRKDGARRARARQTSTRLRW